MKLLTLTQLTNKQSIVINPDHIVSFETNPHDKMNGTIVALVNRTTYTVLETVSEIKSNAIFD
jgi:uncharacterized protein YlzI (FlbEa/FlbD family)